MLDDAFQQRLLDRGLVRLGIGPAGEPDRAKAPAAGRRDRAGRRIEVAVVPGLDPVGEEVEDGRLIDRRCGQDACARRVACDFADRQPLAARQRRRGIEPEAASADRLPALARSDRGGARRDRERRARGHGRQIVLVGVDGPRRRGAAASPRPTSLRLPRAGERSPRHRRQRNSRSGSLPPRPRSVRSTATSAAAAPKPRSRASSSMCARRGSSGSAAIARPCAVMRPVLIDRAERSKSLARFAISRSASGAIEEGQAGADRLRPTAGRSAAELDRSASRISGGSWAGSEALAASSHSRIATPGPCRAARPARWVTAARLARSVTSRVRPAPRS